MKVLVPVKRVVDYNIKPRVAADGSGVETQGLKMSMNPFDEVALEEAVRLRENGGAAEVIVVAIGPKATADTLRTAMAMGADRAIHILTDEAAGHDGGIEPLAMAHLLEEVVKKEQPGLVSIGKQAIDDDMSVTGQILAARLGWPQATFASKLELLPEGRARVTREIDGGVEVVEVSLPAVITADLRLNNPRFATLPNIMKARKKPIETIEAGSLGADTKPRLETLNVREPAERKPGIIVSSVEELLDKLKNEAKVL
ncbi:electron transfer flavoprotein subunit beta/FixA family protein [Oecophyllibacter saccharovorans]|uniref:electron transfer flavoprotein subunit beta/FixA family protein n=1 Tax=Oecophyllibacter saccharovorans TaxID=2558360 RepID=UPI001143D0D7|nr:electron transfer flavoprotein subunit beta/FixA family protein [Oecophyllibacter saccharovorans]QDH14935.1 electron transfer flavoprotein subunit beta/FixA family protein [Oecophyllibacter saccharovorans]